MSEPKTRVKDKWDMLQIAAQTTIAVVALLFTVVFGIRQQKNAEATLQLASSNFEVAKTQTELSKEQVKNSRTQVESALLPALTSGNAQQRELAIQLAKALDESFASVVLSVLAVSDPDPYVRSKSRLTLRTLSSSTQEEVKQKAETGLERSGVMEELRTKGLLKKLSDAQNYLNVENVSGKETALRIYLAVLNELSPNARGKLDQRQLNSALSANREGHIDDAVRAFSRLFSQYLEA